MKLLVTGGLGFIGSNFVRWSLKKHPALRIVNLDLRTYAGNPANLKGMDGAARHRWVRGDIADPKTVAKAMRGVDAVVHFAAESHVDRSILDASAFLRTNVTGTQVLLDAARAAGVGRFVHVSTDEVYGSVERGESKEADPLLPNSPYAASKAASDLMVRAAFVTHEFPVLVTRCSNNFGPYQFPEKALPLMITNWLDGIPFPLYGDGLNIRDWVHVTDHCRGVDLVLRKGTPGEVYNIGGTASLTNKQLIERVRRIMGVPPTLVTPVPDRKGHDRRYAVDCSKLRRLGFRHETTFEEALRRTVAWYRANEAWWRPLKGRKDVKTYYKANYGFGGKR
ncbi:MAG: dTDP-glucose 4,6-dehydratase [Elusimicrobia bacterium]|nr:dTDP-glucose 4,6-dehydratase [Elusimicrobiota bacterium]